MAQVGCCDGGRKLKGQPAGQEKGQTEIELRDPQHQETGDGRLLSAQLGRDCWLKRGTGIPN